MKRILVVTAALLIAVITQSVNAEKAFAIAAFSRQHKTECTTCHTIYPELNEYGEAFRKNGFIPFGKHGVAKTPETADAGGTGTKVNEGILLSGIPELLPLSLTASLDAAYNEHPVNNDKVDLSTRSLMLQAGGAFRGKAGFYATYNAYTEGTYDPLASATPGNNNPELKELFLVWHHAFDTPVNLRAGRMEPQLTLWKRSDKLTVDSFAPTSYRVGRSQFSIDAPEDALEINSIIGKRVFVAGGVVDRNGQNAKEGYGHISFRIGGADFIGGEPSIDLDNESILDYTSMTLAAYGYAGKNALTQGGVATIFNHYYRAGVDLDLFVKRLRVRTSGVKGRDSDPFYAAGGEVKSIVLAAEGEYMFDTNIIGIFRYEYEDNIRIRRRYIPAVAYAPLQNIKLTLEYKYEDDVDVNRIALLGAKFSF